MNNRLLPEDHVHIENILIARKIFGRILNFDLIPPNPGVSRLKAADELATGVISACKNTYSIKAEINYCFIESMQANAFAAYVPAVNKYFIIILAGALAVQERLEPLLTNSTTRQLLGLTLLAPGESDPSHEVNLGTLTAMSLHWLLHHELGHIVNGHLHLDTSTAYGAVASEQMCENNERDKNITMHTLEMDADTFASTVTFGTTMRAREFGSPCTLLSSPLNIAKVFAFSMYAMMRSFDLKDWAFDRLWEFTHPPALVRVSQIGAWGATVFEKRTEFGISPLDWAGVIANCVRTVEAEIFGDTMKMSQVEEFFESGKWQNYGRELSERWNALRPRLEPHSLGEKRLAPTQTWATR